jgi:NAD(P)-dependent dehydrogenase (short-subunit alcohol dehydrogenase family)
MSTLSNRTIIVTGGAQGIGAAYARGLAASGAAVAICDLVEPEDTVRSIEAAGGQALGWCCDVSNGRAITAFVSATAQKFGPIDGLVNNAAIFAALKPKPIDQIDSAEFDRVLRVNVRGPFECIKAVLPIMRKQRYGKIVNVASGTVFKGSPMMLPYVSSKGAVVALTRAVAREVGGDGICVNCIAPGLTMSEGVKNNRDYSDDMLKGNVASRCIPREQVPDDLVGVVRFLLSAESDFMTGQTVVVDGGSVLH